MKTKNKHEDLASWLNTKVGMIVYTPTRALLMCDFEQRETGCSLNTDKGRHFFEWDAIEMMMETTIRKTEEQETIKKKEEEQKRFEMIVEEQKKLDNDKQVSTVKFEFENSNLPEKKQEVVELKVHEPLELKSLDNETMLTLKNELLDSLAKVKRNKEHLPVAQSVIAITNAMCNLAKVEIETHKIN